jgi:hypothetical protein
MKDDAERIVFASKTFSTSQSTELLGAIVAAVTKMTRAKTFKLPNPFPPHFLASASVFVRDLLLLESVHSKPWLRA